MSNKLLKETDTKKKKTAKHSKSVNVHTSEAEARAKAEAKKAEAKKADKQSVKSEGENDKALTKYDKKVAKRKHEQLKAEKRRKITVITSIILAVVVIAGVAISTWTNYDKIHNRYIAVDDDSISEIEFDFYYNLSKTAMLSQTLYGDLTYKSYFESYMGYDSSKPDKNQKYSSTENTWYDYFANNALTTIKEHKALLKDAENKGFTYNDGDSDYEAFCADITDAAGKAGKSIKDYYKTTFGNNATQSNLKSYVYEYLKANAYQEKLTNELTPSDTDITDYYNDHKADYDTINYRSFTFTAEDATNEASKTTAKASAQAMLGAVTDESSFAELCRKNATDDQRDQYADDNGSLATDAVKSTMDTALADWMYNDARVAGNKDVIENADKGTYTVVYFISRQKPDTADDTIKSTILNKKYTEVITGYADNMTVNNIKNRIKTMTK